MPSSSSVVSRSWYVSRNRCGNSKSEGPWSNRWKSRMSIGHQPRGFWLAWTYIALMVKQRASPTGELVLLNHRDFQPGFRKSCCGCYSTNTGSLEQSLVYWTLASCCRSQHIPITTAVLGRAIRSFSAIFDGLAVKIYIATNSTRCALAFNGGRSS